MPTARQTSAFQVHVAGPATPPQLLLHDKAIIFSSLGLFADVAAANSAHFLTVVVTLDMPQNLRSLERAEAQEPQLQNRHLTLVLEMMVERQFEQSSLKKSPPMS